MSSTAPPPAQRPPPLSVAVQGERGCFSHAAAEEFFGEVDLVPCRDFRALFRAVEGGQADRAVLPVENALAGAVPESLDLLVSRSLRAVGETYVRIEMCLVAHPGTSVDELTAVGSHPVALQQCRDFFDENPGIRPRVAHDTAGAVRDLLSDSTETDFDGAIGPALAAEIYGGEILLRGIEDHGKNFTRFLVIATEEVAREAAPVEKGREKISLAFTLPHIPGALHRATGAFAEASLDLTRLESRPIPGRPWEYRFLCDVRIRPEVEGDAFESALARLRDFSPEVRILGRYAEVDAPSRVG